ncbi:hemocytin [Caerostris extrusa]|uniref:Hemocytin n=1 Tax=Caerostris extrusa TaxID=172846 RepID=A0AAV4VWH8_CAEEX|nr:hemocytin [Caerostris extrusa]
MEKQNLHRSLPALYDQTMGLCGTFNHNQKDDFMTPENDLRPMLTIFASPAGLRQVHQEVSADPPTDLSAKCNRRNCPMQISVLHFEKATFSKVQNSVPVVRCTKSGNPCTCTCEVIASNEYCEPQCVQGCTCPDGMALNSEGFCVAVDQCPCFYKGKEYPASDVIVQGDQVCTCVNAKWECKMDLEKLTQAPATGVSERLIETESHDLCKDGLILDTDIQKCVDIKQCGCIHANQRYKEGDTIKQFCNLCTCQTGEWQCTENVCPGICTAWGESHFKSYDGKIFDFHGDCEYVLSKGRMKGSSFSINVQNVPCGTSGVTCSKAFTLELGNLKQTRGDTNEIIAPKEKLTLVYDNPLPKMSLSSRFVVLESGLFVLVYTDVGVTIRWDKGTRIYVTLDPKWRNRVTGICGNFNDDQADDFLTPSGGIPEARASIFADSWKVQEFCPATQVIEDTCEIHPPRKAGPNRSAES